jgi:hypothetical protein
MILPISAFQVTKYEPPAPDHFVTFLVTTTNEHLDSVVLIGVSSFKDVNGIFQLLRGRREHLTSQYLPTFSMVLRLSC